MINEMLPCPFCGGKAEIAQTGKNELTAYCTVCKVGFINKVLRYSLDWLANNMTEKWNKRTQYNLVGDAEKEQLKPFDYDLMDKQIKAMFPVEKAISDEDKISKICDWLKSQPEYKMGITSPFYYVAPATFADFIVRYLTSLSI